MLNEFRQKKMKKQKRMMKKVNVVIISYAVYNSQPIFYISSTSHTMYCAVYYKAWNLIN